MVVHLEEACQVHALQPVHGQSVLLSRISIHVPHEGIRLQHTLEPDLDRSRLRRNSAGLQHLRDRRDERSRHRQADLLVVEHRRGRLTLIGIVQSAHHGHTSRRVHLIRLAVAEDQEWVSLQLITLKLVRGLQVRIDHGEVCLAFLRSRAGHILSIVVVLFLQQRAALTLSSLHSWCGSWRHSRCCSRHRSWCHSRRWSATAALSSPPSFPESSSSSPASSSLGSPPSSAESSFDSSEAPAQNSAGRSTASTTCTTDSQTSTDCNTLAVLHGPSTSSPLMVSWPAAAPASVS